MRKQGRIPVPQAAKIAMISEGALRGWVRSKKVDGVMYAHQWWVLEESLRDAIEPVAP
jgi:hypothetical protein